MLAAATQRNAARVRAPRPREGAFTGAVRDKAGLFEVAGKGTISLDEIGGVAPTVQAKLLRALQEQDIRRVGAERSITVSARVVAATSRDLRALTISTVTLWRTLKQYGLSS